MKRSTATLIGCLAILLWAILALLTAASGEVPPFQLAAMTFAIGGFSGASFWILRPRRIGHLRQPWRVWLLGVAGLFGYHFCYFTALRNAPTVEASLIAYLWPLLIVLFSALLPGEKLRWYHVMGALLGFAGAVLIVTRGAGLSISPEYWFGYSVALIAALIWSSYSVLSRRFSETPTDVVTGFCLVSSVLAWGCHLMLETTVWPTGTSQWLAVLGLGFGPLGMAFFAWDLGVKRGDIQILGVGSYAAPLLSTLILLALGYSEPTWSIAAACLLITAGALLAAKDMLVRR